MTEWEIKKVLMFVKTYPSPSTAYHETVCTAGITSNLHWIRLYPIPYRYLSDDKQFKKYTWIECKTQRNPKDKRPESFKIDRDSIKIIKHLKSDVDCEERKKYILPLVSSSYNSIFKANAIDGTSLGIFKPDKVIDFIIKPTAQQWDEKRQAILNQQVFGGSKPLEKVPYDFSFRFRCFDDKNDHILKTTDWEVYQTFRSFRNYYSTEKEALDRLKKKYLDIFTDAQRKSYLVVGTVHRWRNKFIVIGYYSYKNKSKKECPEQMSLF